MTTTQNGTATSTAKKVNYTEAQKAEIVELYIKSGKDSSSDALGVLGKTVSRTVPSVRQVLIGEGVYKKLDASKPKKASQMPKVKLVTTLETVLGLESGALDSLDKANKEALNNLLEALQGDPEQPTPKSE